MECTNIYEPTRERTTQRKEEENSEYKNAVKVTGNHFTLYCKKSW